MTSRLWRPTDHRDVSEVDEREGAGRVLFQQLDDGLRLDAASLTAAHEGAQLERMHLAAHGARELGRLNDALGRSERPDGLTHAADGNATRTDACVAVDARLLGVRAVGCVGWSGTLGHDESGQRKMEPRRRMGRISGRRISGRRPILLTQQSASAASRGW